MRKYNRYLISDDAQGSETESVSGGASETSTSVSSQTDKGILGTQVTMKLLALKNQIKIYHWQTQSHPEHKALDKLFDILNDQNDRWVETFMGKYGRIQLTPEHHLISLANLSDLPKEPQYPIRDYLADWVEEIRGIRDAHFNGSEDSDLSNIFDEIFGDIHKTRYLLTLK